MKYAVVTGISKGLGESIAELFIEAGIGVFGVSRSGNDRLKKLADQNQVIYEHFTCDLGDISVLEKTIDAISEQIFSEKPEASTIYIVNNAAVLEPINQAMNIKGDELAYHVQVNTVAPMIIMNAFLKKATCRNIPLIGATITSGAANRATYGWSAYCITKASMNMYTKTVALEQDEIESGNKIIAFSPGIMDTNMQGEIRGSSFSEFIEVDAFKRYKQNNLLEDPDTVGRVLVEILEDVPNIKNGKIYSVNDYL